MTAPAKGTFTGRLSRGNRKNCPTADLRLSRCAAASCEAKRGSFSSLGFYYIILPGSANGPFSCIERPYLSCRAGAAGPPFDGYLDCPTGQVVYYFSDRVFRWSEGQYRIYGYSPGEVVPSMDMALAHIEPPDRAPVLAFWEKVSLQGGPSSIYVSIRDSKDRQHKLLFSADFILSEGSPVGVRGITVDLTQAIHTDRHQLATEAVAASALNRAAIEQAKGILMARSGIDADRAYEIINQLSQDINRKVHAIAHEIIGNVVVHDSADTTSGN